MVQLFRRALVLLALLAAGLAVPALAGPTDAARLAALARDVDRVESVRAIKRTQLAWPHYIDMGEWDRAAALFTDDAELAHGDDHFHGRPELRAYFQRMIGKGTTGLPEKTVHTPFMMAPIITLNDDGNSAKGRWHAFSMRGSLGGDAVWQGGIFECEYVRLKGVWKISRQIFYPQLLGPYETGWRPFRPELPMVPYSYRPEDMGKPFELGPAVAAAPPQVWLASLAGRIQALRDEAAVRNLQDAYGYYVDFKMWDDVVDLFAPGGSVSISGIGTWTGPKGIRRSFERSGPAGLRYGEVNDHLQLDLIVEVAADGVHARARGIQLGMIGLDNDKAWWTLTRFDNLFVKQGGIWRIDRMRKAMWLMTDYTKGWAKDWSVPTSVPPAFKPDGPAAPLPPLWALERPAPVATARPATTLAAAETALHVAGGYDAVENLAGAYGNYLDDNQWEELGSIFAAQGERDSAGGGFIRTPARIASFSRGRYGPYNPHRTALNMHMRTQPVIHFSPDGQKAQMRTRLFQTVIVPTDDPRAWTRTPMFVTGMYEDDIVFEGGMWKVERADLDHLIYAPYDKGWTHLPEGWGKRMTPPLKAGVKFDAPGAGDHDPAFPRVPHMWFHYRNPVSGRNPPYLMPKYVLPEP
jgi:hypothetical protein